jgi:hypothetical protein
MVNKNHIEESRQLVSVFIEAFYSSLNGPVPHTNLDHYSGTKTGNIAFKVTGEIHRYILALRKSQTGIEKNPELDSDYSEKLIKCFKQMIINREKLSGFNLEALNEKLIDDLVYSIRKINTQITMRVNTPIYVVELYAFTDDKILLASPVQQLYKEM